MGATNWRRGYLRARLFRVLHKPEPADPLARWTNYFLAALILGNALCVGLESVPGVAAKFGAALQWVEWVSTAFFAVEYAARLWVCVEQQRYSHPLRGRAWYALHPLPLLDLVVIATVAMPIDLRFLRVARMVRLLKVLRLESLDRTLQAIGSGLFRRRTLLLLAVVVMGLGIFAASALVYQLEREAQPQVFASIPHTLWWAMATLTTVGYGDMVPVTVAGRVAAGLIAMFGIGIFALPAAIVTAVVLEAGESDPEPVRCPKCGHEHDGRT